jgi:hypothetical protein
MSLSVRGRRTWGSVHVRRRVRRAVPSPRRARGAVSRGTRRLRGGALARLVRARAALVFPGLLPPCSTWNTAGASGRVATGCAVSRSSLSSAWTSDARCESARSASRWCVPRGCHRGALDDLGRSPTRAAVTRPRPAERSADRGTAEAKTVRHCVRDPRVRVPRGTNAAHRPGLAASALPYAGVQSARSSGSAALATRSCGCTPRFTWNTAVRG